MATLDAQLGNAGLVCRALATAADGAARSAGDDGILGDEPDPGGKESAVPEYRRSLVPLEKQDPARGFDWEMPYRGLNLIA